MKSYTTWVDKLFWFSLIMYSDPGGYLFYYFKGAILPGKLSFQDFFSLLMILLYILLPKKEINSTYSEITKVIKPNIGKLIIFISIYLFYFFFAFGIIIPDSSLGMILNFIRQTREVFFYMVLVYPVFIFTLRSLPLFIKYFLYSSLIILIFQLATIYTGIQFIPIVTAERQFLYGATRYFLGSYGMLPILPNLAMVMFLFKIKIPRRKLILFLGLLMSFSWILSITRRHILGMIIVFFMYYFFYQKWNHKPIISSKFIRPAFVIIIAFISLSLLFPSQAKNTFVAIENTYSTFILGEETVYGKQDTRLQFDQTFFISLINNSPILGTGYTPNWFVGEGKSEGGQYEASDYPFLAALAAFGVLGLVVFSYYYLWLIKYLRHIYFYLKGNLKIINVNSQEFLFVVTFFGYFTYVLFQYMNWFGAMGLRNAGSNFFIIAIFYGSLVRLRKIDTIKNHYRIND